MAAIPSKPQHAAYLGDTIDAFTVPGDPDVPDHRYIVVTGTDAQDKQGVALEISLGDARAFAEWVMSVIAHHNEEN